MRPGETSTERDPHALADLLLDPAGDGSHQELAGRVQQQHGGGVDRHQVANLVEQLLQQLVHSQLRPVRRRSRPPAIAAVLPRSAHARPRPT